MSPADVVHQFIAAWALGLEEHQAAVRDLFLPDTVWENVGTSRTTGPDEALAFMDQVEQAMGLARIDVDMLALATHGDLVLTERVDHLRTADGAPLGSVRLMGVFEVRDGKIAAWRDYFDSKSIG